MHARLGYLLPYIPRKAIQDWGGTNRPGRPPVCSSGLNCPLFAEARMRDLSRSCLAIFLAVAFLFTPASWAADSSAAGTATPATTAATAAPTAVPSLGTSINPTLVDLLVKKGIISTSEANSLRNASGSAGMDQLLLLLKSKGLVSDSEVNDLKTASESDSHAL